MEREMQRRELADHIKLGPGGIREIEFIVQALQITRGGRDRRLQTPSLLAALARIGETRLLPRQAAEELGAAYTFLRRLENRLQMLADAQVHRVPAEASRRGRTGPPMGCGASRPFSPGSDRSAGRARGPLRLVGFGGPRPDAA